MKGIVKVWFDGKGYGFIEGEDKKTYFVHQSTILCSGWRSLVKGQEVEFEVADGEKGPQAVNVWPGDKPLYSMETPSYNEKLPPSFRDMIVEKVLDVLEKERKG